MDILEYLAIWRRQWWIVAGALVLGLLTATLVCVFTRPQYIASSKLFVTTTGGASVVEAYQGNLFGEERVKSYAKLASSQQVAQRAIDQLQIDMSARDLMSQVSAKPVENTVILDISVSATNPDLARDLTNAVALQTTQVVAQLETSARGGSPAATATLFDEAVAPSKPAKPNWWRNLIVGALAGLLLGLIAAIARDKLLGSVVSSRDALDAADTTLVGSVPRRPFVGAPDNDASGDGRPLAFAPAAVEAFRAIRTSVVGAAESPTGALVVAGATTGAGATTVCLGLAGAIAEVGRSVVVVDCNLRDRDLSSLLGLDGDIGLSDILTGSTVYSRKLAARTDTANMYVLPGGTGGPDAPDLLGADIMGGTIKQLAHDYDVVILDGAPLLPYSDSVVLANWTDGVLLVARAGVTTRDDIGNAAAKVRTARVNVYGLVLTDAN